MVHTNSFFFAAKGSKIILGVLIAFGLLGVLVWMLRSMGIDRNTPPSMIFRKLRSFLYSYLRPFVVGGKWKRAVQLEEKNKFDAAVDVYVRLFDYDGLLNSRASIAIHNDRVLGHLEDICKQVGYPFPTGRINRLREDIFDYFLVKVKVLTPSDYDGTALTRPENEQRFADKLNLTQELKLIEGFHNFLLSFASKLKKHITSGAPPIEMPQESPSSVSLVESGMGEVASPVDPFGASAAGGGAVEAPPHLFGPSAEALSNPPGIFGEAAASQDAPLPPPPDAFAGGRAVGDANPFSLDDPHSPHHDMTGRIHKLPGEEDDSAFRQELSNVDAGLGAPPLPDEGATQIAPIPQAPPSQPPMGGPAMGAVPPNLSMPQPTGGFPGFGQATPRGPAAGPGTPSFPQPTGGFPGFGSAPPPPTPAPGSQPPGAPNFPQPTGGFPGFGSAPPASASQPPGAPNFPQPTGGFPGFGSAPPAGPATQPPAAPNFPQPTGGFPGFGSAPPTPASQPPSAPNFPQPTGGFPGFGSAPPTPASQPPGAPNFPQPTGGFPGFGTPPDEKKK